MRPAAAETEVEAKRKSIKALQNVDGRAGRHALDPLYAVRRSVITMVARDVRRLRVLPRIVALRPRVRAVT